MPPNVPPSPDFNRILNEAKVMFRGGSNIMRLLSATGLSGFFAYGLYQSVYFVQGGHRAVKFNRITGLYDTTYGEGANFSIPYIETPVIFDIRNRPTEVQTSTGSFDLQTVNVAVRVLYQPNVRNLHHIYRNIGPNYAETVLPSLINEIIRAVIAQFNASDLLTKRPEVSNRIALTLAERAKRFNIDITDVSITQMSFGKEYTNAVEAKQIAQQMAERAKWRVEQATQEKQASIHLAEGEAAAAKLVGDAVKSNPAFIELRGLEASRAISKMISEKAAGRFFLDSDCLLLDNITRKRSNETA